MLRVLLYLTEACVVTNTARNGALTPFVPVGHNAIEWARAIIARLRLMQRWAGLASILRVDSDVAPTRLDTAFTRLVTLRPDRPSCNGTVDRARRRRLRALALLRQRRTRLATVLYRALDLADTALRAASATCNSGIRPWAPCRHVAVNGTRHSVAIAFMGQGRTRIAAVLGHGPHPSLATLLSAPAAGSAVAVTSPRGDDTVNWARAGIAFFLLEKLLTHQPTV